MNTKYISFSVIGALLITFITGCSGNRTENKNDSDPAFHHKVEISVIIDNETSALLSDLKENGDYINSQAFPSLIKASIVHESLGGNILVIDLRPSKQFSEGHIRGAINKKFEELPFYFESGIKPFEFDKIIMVCESGQISSYTTSLLRLMGYGNVYAMRWGMSSWNEKYAKSGWLKDLSGKYESKLESGTNEKPVSRGMPELKTGFSTGKEVGDERFKKLFASGTGDIIITADEVFSDPAKYFIINLERKDKYEDGHIPGAIRYKPESTLGFTDEMASIPYDKTVVLYCGTGHNSGFASAYLRLFGYDARTLKYGNNSFMYDRMVSKRTELSWLPFTSSEVNNFDVVK